MVNKKQDSEMFKIHPDDEATFRTNLENTELIKTVQVEDDVVVNETYHGDMKELSPMSKEEQYEALMNIFLNRKDKRKLNRDKGKLSFTDRIYKNIKK